MDRDSEKKVTTMVRALEYLRAHPDDDAAYEAMLAGFQTQVEKALSEHERYVNGRAVFSAGVARRKALRTELLRRYVKPAAQVAGRVAATQPESGLRLSPPASGASYEQFRAGAHAVLSEVKKHQSIVAAHGLGARFVTDFEAALAEYDQAVETMHQGRRAHVGATSTLKVALSECMGYLRLFDGVNAWRFAARPDLLAEWASARNVAWERSAKAKPEAREAQR
jgi:hypothetical protein